MATIAAFNLAKSAVSTFSSEKPHTSITDWVDILSSEKYGVDDYDGIPELVESVNILGSEGTTEASRAIRKKLKYGNVHRQLRALTILKALVENCGEKFQLGFADSRLIERIKLMSADPMTDDAVKKRLMSVMASWYREFKDEPRMKEVANLYFACGGGKRTVSHTQTSQARRSSESSPPDSHMVWEEHQRIAEEEARLRQERKRAQKEEEKRKVREEKEAREQKERERVEKEKKAKEQAKRKASQPQGQQRVRKRFDFEAEKPQILTSIANGSQASNNLVNALKLVNREKETVQANPRVQECLGKVKLERKQIIRYIQLVENEEFIGTLLETNERIISAISLYDQMCKSAEHDSDDEHPPAAPAADPTAVARARLESAPVRETELDKLQIRQRERVERASSIRSVPRASNAYVHPDLRDLNFDPLGSSDARGALPTPIEPRAPDEDEEAERQAGLSDYSDYDSEDEQFHPHPEPSSPGVRIRVSADPSTSGRGYEALEEEGEPRTGLLIDDSDPFADPEEGVSTPGIVDKKPVWAH